MRPHLEIERMTPQGAKEASWILVGAAIILTVVVSLSAAYFRLDGKLDRSQRTLEEVRNALHNAVSHRTELDAELDVIKRILLMSRQKRTD